MAGNIDTLYDRQAESGCLAGAGLSQSHKVVVAMEEYGNNLFLHGHRGFKTHISYTAEQVVAYA